jgi:hypothetical protein
MDTFLSSQSMMFESGATNQTLPRHNSTIFDVTYHTSLVRIMSETVK